ncbi:hypothetical protein GVX86_08615, partial [[Haemophilus] felis]|nr:hypothetical protein [[Haemophilus] felis]
MRGGGYAYAKYLGVNSGTGIEGYQANAENQNDDGAKGNGSLAVGKADYRREDSVLVSNGIFDQGNGAYLTMVGNQHWIQQNQGDFGITVLGAKGQINGRGIIQVGFNNFTYGPGNISIGNKIEVNGTQGESIGIIATKQTGGARDFGSSRRDSFVFGDGNVGIGSGVQIGVRGQNTGQPQYAVAIGYDTVVKKIGSIAIGRKAENTTLAGIVLGEDSYSSGSGTKNGEMKELGYNPAEATTTDNATWKATLGELSIGRYDDTGVTQKSRRIANVAAGVLEADAVNVAQLKAVELKIQDDATQPNKVNINLKNDTLKIGGDANIEARVVPSTTTPTTTTPATTTEKKLSVTLKPNLTGISSISGPNTTTGNQTSTKIDFTDTALTLNDKKITGLADGDLSNSSTDAITGKQFVEKAKKLAEALGGNATVSDTDGQFTQPTYNLKTKNDGTIGTTAGNGTGGSYNNVGDALNALDKGLAKLLDEGMKFSNGQTEQKAKLGNKVTIEASGTTDADKLITVNIASDNADGA